HVTSSVTAGRRRLNSVINHQPSTINPELPALTDHGSLSDLDGGAERWCFRRGGKIPPTNRASVARAVTPRMPRRTNAPYKQISSLPAIACLPPLESYIAPASLSKPP